MLYRYKDENTQNTGRSPSLERTASATAPTRQPIFRPCSPTMRPAVTKTSVPLTPLTSLAAQAMHQLKSKNQSGLPRSQLPCACMDAALSRHATDHHTPLSSRCFSWSICVGEKRQQRSAKCPIRNFSIACFWNISSCLLLAVTKAQGNEKEKEKFSSTLSK